MSKSIAFALPAAPLTVRFDGPQLTSDGGLCWLAEADRTLGLCAALAAQIPEWRRGPVRHSLETLVRQRVLQVACGYEDQNDATTLRRDPLLKLVCGRLPAEADLASQPTLSRLENAVDARACYRLAAALVQVYVQQREQDGVPQHIVLDLDGTDDPAHGEQEGVAYHGYYGQHMYYPLLVFDGTTGQLITAVLRPGTCHASRGGLAVLRRLVRAIRARWPAVRIEVRADAGFAVPAVYEYLEAEQITYTIGLASNKRLAALAAPLAAAATAQRAQTGEQARLFAETPYQAGSWPAARRVIIKTEALAKGPNIRFVVTTRADAPPGAPPAARHPAPAPDQDRWLVPQPHRRPHAAPGQQSSRRAALAPPRLPSRPPGRVEDGRGGHARRGSVSRPRSSNRTCGFPASGFPTGFIARHTTLRHSGPDAAGARRVHQTPLC
jgi:Transposase DDE domain group 1